MAYLIKCRTCNKDVSNEALTCPHCGDPYITEERKNQSDIKKEKNNEAYRKYLFIKEKLDDLNSDNTYGSCDVCGKRKKYVLCNDNSGYWIKDCNCSWNEYCKHYYRITHRQLVMEAFN